MGQATPVPGVDPSTVTTPRQLRQCLRGLKERRGLTYSALDARARELPAHGERRLPSSTLGDLLADNDRMPSNKAAFVTFLAACEVSGGDRVQWLAAWERAATANLVSPAGAVRVPDGRARLLGVHAAIRVDGAAGELPPYVPRDLDADLCAALATAALAGGFVLLMGGSSVGKTRALFEAVRAALPEWWLLHPADTPVIGAHAAVPTPRTVLWLDELQRYLGHPAGLTLGVLHRLITAGTVVVATLWSDEYSKRTARPAAGQPDPYAEDREILRLADVIRVPDRFSAAELRRGEALANTDRRLRIALDTTDAGFTQVLAAGPALIQRWETAEDCYGQAVITAALDARRVGAQHPITRNYVTAATPAYLTPIQQATAPSDWLEQALAYATKPVHGASGCLNPAPAGMGSIAGWTAADYLHQHAQRSRRTTPLPDAVWQALAEHHHPDDTARLADNALRRGHPELAVSLYTRIGLTIDRDTADWLVATLIRRGRVDQALQLLRDRADSGDRYAPDSLARCLVELGRIDELRVRADRGDPRAADLLADLLAKEHGTDELRRCADAGDRHAARALIDHLAEQRQVDELRDRANDGDEHAARALGHVLTLLDDIDGLRQLADAGIESAAIGLVIQLSARGDVTGLHERAAAGDPYAERALARLHINGADADELRRRASSGDREAVERYADLMVGQGRVDEALQVLRNHVDAGHDTSSGLTTDRDTANMFVAAQLARLLSDQGRIDELRTRADAGDEHAAMWLDIHLSMRENIDELRERADKGDAMAAASLVMVLVKLERFDELEDEVAAGTFKAAEAWSRVRKVRPDSDRD